MKQENSQQLQAIKNDYIKLEIRFNEERENYHKLTRTLLQLLGSNDGIEEDVKRIRQLLETEPGISGANLEEVLESLRHKMLFTEFSAEENKVRQNKDFYLIQKIDILSGLLTQIMQKMLEEFYPLSDALLVKADGLSKKLNKDEEIDRLSPAFLTYIDELKTKIADEHEYIACTVMELFRQFRNLEETVFRELSLHERTSGLSAFEKKFDDEYSSLIESINPKATISNIRKAVVNKFELIKGAISLWKKKEAEKAQATNHYITRLRSKINNVERDAKKLTFIAKRFQQEASTDKLTGLHAKHTIDVELKNLLKNFHENNEPFSVILFDVDKFKQINDSYGHVAGDTVLAQVATCLKESFRPDDFLARFGGDEFIAIIEGFNREMAETRLDIFRENLKKRKFKSRRKGDVLVTISAGIVVPKQGDTVQTILERADRAMYMDKKITLPSIHSTSA